MSDPHVAMAVTGAALRASADLATPNEITESSDMISIVAVPSGRVRCHVAAFTLDDRITPYHVATMNPSNAKDRAQFILALPDGTTLMLTACFGGSRCAWPRHPSRRSPPQLERRMRIRSRPSSRGRIR